ncbi:hypothetical protein Z043_112985 [Scleropages formosus]|uniref:Uncharacterized protein n=1 Tax=Scleropages formosus TaxID=113540 RepID=A0A0P7V1Y5_SCLFO|nr:hypothetical protein Z043_112985 [Scleropages formosus]
MRSQEYPITKETAKKLAQRPQWNAGIRPGPARQAVPRMSAKGLKASQRSQRSSPCFDMVVDSVGSHCKEQEEHDLIPYHFHTFLCIHGQRPQGLSSRISDSSSLSSSSSSVAAADAEGPWATADAGGDMEETP